MAAPAPHIITSTFAPDASVPSTDEPHIESALELFEGDTEIFYEVADLFLREYPRQLATIREAIARGHATVVERTAHSLKGSVSNFAFPAAFHATEELEKMGRRGDLTGAEEIFHTLEKRLELLRETLAGLQKEHAR